MKIEEVFVFDNGRFIISKISDSEFTGNVYVPKMLAVADGQYATEPRIHYRSVSKEPFSTYEEAEIWSIKNNFIHSWSSPEIQSKEPQFLIIRK